jgi:hypothetical protein
VLAGTDEKSDHRRAGIGEDDADDAKGVPTPSDVGEADMVAKLYTLSFCVFYSSL